MIDITKKYQTRDGKPVEIIAVNGREPFPVIGYVGDTSTVVSMWRKSGSFLEDEEENRCDLIEISPYADWEIDDKILVSDDGIVWQRRHFVGISDAGFPQAWYYGETSWTSHGGKYSWKYAKKPDEDKGE